MQSTKSPDGYGMGKLMLGVFIGLLLMPLAVLVYLRLGHPPVAVADAAFPFEAQIVHLPLNARTARDMPKRAPFAGSEDVYEAGARTYRKQCSSCHGVPGTDSEIAKHIYPSAPQLWRKHGNSSVVGVSDDEAGETYWKVANGIRLTGMPSYDHLLSDEQIWQVSLLLKNADQNLSESVRDILKNPTR